MRAWLPFARYGFDECAALLQATARCQIALQQPGQRWLKVVVRAEREHAWAWVTLDQAEAIANRARLAGASMELCGVSLLQRTYWAASAFVVPLVGMVAFAYYRSLLVGLVVIGLAIGLSEFLEHRQKAQLRGVSGFRVQGRCVELEYETKQSAVLTLQAWWEKADPGRFEALLRAVL